MFRRRNPAEGSGRAERSVRVFLLGTALALGVLSLVAFVVPALTLSQPNALAAVSWRPTAIAAFVLIGLWIGEQVGAWVMFGLGIALLELPALLSEPLTLAALATSSQTLLIGPTLGFVGTVTLRLGRIADDVWARRVDASASAAAAAGASAARAQAAALVHDEVLQVLNLATSPVAVDGMRLADQASLVRGMLLDASSVPQPTSLIETLRETAYELDPLVEFEVHETHDRPLPVPHFVLHAIRNSMRETLRNSLTHAGATAHRTVRIDHEIDSLVVTVADDGVGFDISRVPDRRLGLITARRALRSVGADLVVHSELDTGTTVTVQWPSAQSTNRPDVAPKIGTLPLVRVGALITAAAFALSQTALATLATSTAKPSWVPLGALALLLFAAALLLKGAKERISIAPAITVVGLTIAAVTLGLSAASFDIGDLWFAGAAAFVLSALAFRGRPAIACAGMLLLGLQLVTTGFVSGAPLYLIVAVPVRPIGVTLFAVGLAATINLMLRRISSDLVRTEAELASEFWERSARAELAARAVEALVLVEDVLLELIQGVSLSAHSRSRAAALEGRLRDQVRAGRLTIEPLLTATMRARQRGVDVLLLDDLEGELPEYFDLVKVATAIAAACDSAVEKITVRLLPAGRPAIITLVIDETPIPISENH